MEQIADQQPQEMLHPNSLLFESFLGHFLNLTQPNRMGMPGMAPAGTRIATSIRIGNQTIPGNATNEM